MSRLPAISNETAAPKAKQMLEGVQAKLGITPNMMRTMANSPAVLDAYLHFSGALAGGSLPAKLREQIALAVGEQNGCDYCLSAHSALGKMAGLSDAEIDRAREARSDSAKDTAALRFTRVLVAQRGQIADSDFEALRAAGFGNGEIAEIISHVALNMFTNYFNTAAQVDLDFPRISPRKAA